MFIRLWDFCERKHIEIQSIAEGEVEGTSEPSILKFKGKYKGGLQSLVIQRGTCIYSKSVLRLTRRKRRFDDILDAMGDESRISDEVRAVPDGLN